MQWTGSPRGDVKETVKALRSAIAHKADGIAVSIVDAGARSLPEVDLATKAGIPLVAFNVDSGSSARRFAYVGENPGASGRKRRRRDRAARTTELGDPVRSRRTRRRGRSAACRGCSPAWPARRRRRPRPSSGSPATSARSRTQVEAASRARRTSAGCSRSTASGTLACGKAIQRLGLRTKGVHGGGYDLLPDDLALVADGTLDFVVDQQPYVQGFAPVMQLFLARISQGTVIPWDTETSVLLRKEDVKTFLATKSRFEGSSSRHEYPLRKA